MNRDEARAERLEVMCDCEGCRRAIGAFTLIIEAYRQLGGEEALLKVSFCGLDALMLALTSLIDLRDAESKAHLLEDVQQHLDRHIEASIRFRDRLDQIEKDEAKAQEEVPAPISEDQLKEAEQQYAEGNAPWDWSADTTRLLDLMRPKNKNIH